MRYLNVVEFDFVLLLDLTKYTNGRSRRNI